MMSVVHEEGKKQTALKVQSDAPHMRRNKSGPVDARGVGAHAIKAVPCVISFSPKAWTPQQPLPHPGQANSVCTRQVVVGVTEGARIGRFVCCGSVAATAAPLTWISLSPLANRPRLRNHSFKGGCKIEPPRRHRLRGHI